MKPAPTRGKLTARRTLRVSILMLMFTAVGSSACACVAIIARDLESASTPTQAEIGAAFIFNFAKFTEWPSQTFVDSGSPLTVCFLGADDYRSAFRVIANGKAVNGRWVAVRDVKAAGETRDCQIVYADSTSSAVIVGVLKNARQFSTLAIGTSEDFLARGGTIRLFVESNRMRFDVNVGAVARTKIKLSSKLMALARSVVDLPDPAAN